MRDISNKTDNSLTASCNCLIQLGGLALDAPFGLQRGCLRCAQAFVPFGLEHAQGADDGDGDHHRHRGRERAESVCRTA